MTAETPRDYVLGTTDDEVVRLGFQHRVWAAQAYALWERAGFGPGQTILDVACGPGFGTLDLAHVVGPSGRVIAVDASEKYLALLNERLTGWERGVVDGRPGDVQRLDLPPASIDGAYARWVLCFVPDPDAVVSGVARSLRPGGVFAAQDYFNYASMTLAPKGPALARVVRAVEESWRGRGGDPDVMGRIPTICQRHGLRVTEITPHLRVARPGSMLWHWPDFFFRNYVPLLVEMGLLTAVEQTAFESEWSDRSRDPGAFFTTPPMFDVIAVKDSKS